MKDIRKESLSMDRLEEIRIKVQELEQQKNDLYNKYGFDMPLQWYRENIKPLDEELEYYERLVTRIKRYNVQVGDGVTICYYTDREAGTIIKRTKNTITYQQDKAIRIDNNGMSDCQEYRYERDPNGKVEVYHWSNKYGCFRNSSNHLYVINGRHEYFDYSF